MKNKRFWQGMLLLVLGMAVVGCDNPTNTDTSSVDTNGKNGFVDPYLNGTWDDTWVSWKFDNGFFEILGCGGVIMGGIKGKYSTSEGILSMQTTHLYGDHFALWLDVEIPLGWLTKDQFFTALSNFGIGYNRGSTGFSIPSLFTGWSLLETRTYSVKGNILTFYLPNDTTRELTRRE
ncbi:MAG: hypothetical protein FWB99_10465 [Treponema sp.]|nr:hypothetical protein [Treponema sp.]